MARTARRVTRDDVARIAGVSTAVVSYVLNDGPRPYSESARRRVLAAVEKTGYRIHDVARALASGKSRVFGFAAPSLLNPFIAEVARAIALAAAERGALVLLGDTGEDQRREDRVLRSMIAGSTALMPRQTVPRYAGAALCIRASVAARRKSSARTLLDTARPLKSV